jgi:hypothetical protein
MFDFMSVKAQFIDGLKVCWNTKPVALDVGEAELEAVRMAKGRNLPSVIVSDDSDLLYILSDYQAVGNQNIFVSGRRMDFLYDMGHSNLPSAIKLLLVLTKTDYTPRLFTQTMFKVICTKLNGFQFTGTYTRETVELLILQFLQMLAGERYMINKVSTHKTNYENFLNCVMWVLNYSVHGNDFDDYFSEEVAYDHINALEFYEQILRKYDMWSESLSHFENINQLTQEGVERHRKNCVDWQRQP